MPETSAPLETPLRRLTRACLSHLLLKLTVGPMVGVAIMSVYFWMQRNHLGVRLIVEPGVLDRLLPFHPWWAIPYLWLYPLCGLAAASLVTRRELWNWWLVMAAMPVPAWVAFYFAQSEYPRPVCDPPFWAYSLVIAADAPLNVTPCLHSAYALLGALALNRSLRRCGFGAGVVGAVWLVTAAVILGIVGTRQHSVMDILLSLPLTAVAWWWFRRRVTDLPVSS
jgi:hypothetical protein